MSDVTQVAALGGGVIGASWTALFLAHGLRVNVYDPAAGAEAAVRKHIDDIAPTLQQLAAPCNINAQIALGNLKFCNSALDAVASADFVQESIPERLPLKLKLFAEIESSLAEHAIVSSSASGLMLREMQAGWRDPSRLILGHPFNPPHLIPLVELVANELTADGLLQRAESF